MENMEWDENNEPSVQTDFEPDKQGSSSNWSHLPRGYHPFFEKFEEPSNDERVENGYLNQAKNLKHMADEETDLIKQCILYLEAVLSFLLTADAFDRKGFAEKAAFAMYKDTLSLTKFVSLKLKKLQNTSPYNKLAVLSYSCEALLYYKLFQIRNPEIKDNQILICNYYEMSRNTAPMQSDEINRALDGNCNGESNNQLCMLVPVFLHKAMMKHTQNFSYLLSSLNIWEQMNNVVIEDFVILLERHCKPLMLSSSISDLVNYVQAGIAIIKRDSSTILQESNRGLSQGPRIPPKPSPLLSSNWSEALHHTEQEEYLYKAKTLKHLADEETDTVKRCMLYLEAVLYFSLIGGALEHKNLTNNSAVLMYKETLSLIKFVSSKLQNTTSVLSKLAILSYRCQALLYYKLFKIMKTEMKDCQKLICDYWQKSKNAAPIHSNQINQASGIPQRYMQVPVPVYDAISEQNKNFSYLLSCQEAWEQANNITIKAKLVDFNNKLDRQCKPLTFHSSIIDFVNYMQTALATITKDELNKVKKPHKV